MSLRVTNPNRSLTESAVLLLFLIILLSALYTTMSIFFGVFTYAIILAVSCYGLFEKMVRLLGNKRTIAAIIFALFMIIIIALPFVYIISALGDYAQKAEDWIADAKVNGVPALPAWAAELPIAGKKISAFWDKLQADPASTIGLYGPQIRSVVRHLLTGGLGIVGAAFEFILGVIISAVLLAGGKKRLDPIYAMTRKIIGEEDGPALVDASGRAVKGVAIGVMGTAFIAAVAAWIGFTIAGLSFAIGLAAITFFLVVIQVGPLLVWLPVAIWLGMKGETGWAIFVTVYGIFVLMVIDNVLKPILIARSGRLPILVLFLGVIGGMAAWGFTGMFKGAIILALIYTIVNSWIGHDKKQPEATAAAA